MFVADCCCVAGLLAIKDVHAAQIVITPLFIGELDKLCPPALAPRFELQCTNLLASAPGEFLNNFD